MDMQTIEIDPVEDITFDLNGRPVGITVEDWMDRLGRKLISLYGDDFRQMLNQARAERGLLPLEQHEG